MPDTPPPNFNDRPPVVQTLASGTRYSRLYNHKYPNPLGYGKTPSRFSDPRVNLPERQRYGVLYVGATLAVCFAETVLRDRFVGLGVGLWVDEKELDERVHSEISLKGDLEVVDLTGDGPLRMGMPTDAAHASGQQLGRLWSQAFHDHPQKVNGILYRSRINGDINLAVFNRAIVDLTGNGNIPLVEVEDFAPMIERMHVALIERPTGDFD